MTNLDLLTYNGVPVPWTTPWTGEDFDYRLERERYAPGMLSVVQRYAPGVGRPIFGSIHFQRQRRAVIQNRCDVCGKMIRPGQAAVLLHPGNILTGTSVLGHVMAPSHRECARLAATVCPWILSEIAADRLTVQIVKQHTVAMAILDPDVVEAETGLRRKAFGHAKLIVTKSITRNAAWLMRNTQTKGRYGRTGETE